MIKTIKHIQVKNIRYTPALYKAVIYYEPHPTEFDESDELEKQKVLINKLVKKNWFHQPLRTRRELDSYLKEDY